MKRGPGLGDCWSWSRTSGLGLGPLGLGLGVCSLGLGLGWPGLVYNTAGFHYVLTVLLNKITLLKLS